MVKKFYDICYPKKTAMLKTGAFVVHATLKGQTIAARIYVKKAANVRFKCPKFITVASQTQEEIILNKVLLKENGKQATNWPYLHVCVDSCSAYALVFKVFRRPLWY